MVQEASLPKGRMTLEMMNYIDDDYNTLDVKLAIINAIGWDHRGLMNSKLFFVINKKKYKDYIGVDYIGFKWYTTSD